MSKKPKKKNYKPSLGTGRPKGVKDKTKRKSTPRKKNLIDGRQTSKIMGRPKGSKDKGKRKDKVVKPSPEWFTMKEAAADMGLHVASMRRYCRETRPDDLRLHNELNKYGDRIVSAQELKRFKRMMKGKVGLRNF